NNIIYHNPNLRSSVRWHKIAPIQKVMYKNNPYIKKLGKYIVSTRNGWSPNCKESDSNLCVFGVNSISADSIIKYTDLKYSNETRNNISDFYVNENDLFISRGNTTDLVALASVAKDLPEDQNFIFPDLFIKIEPNDHFLNKEYLAFIFNSIIGRLYFKYSAKGKNQTMVKVSSDELTNFYLPIPPIKTQIKIVDEIKAELDKQSGVKNQIEHKKSKIKEIIEKAISE
ncbi:MAG: restriction endonuclease subunit S, partial [Alphaproteobacteria bacterium]|nr:restriction endonuclease subunit S [Alphaproteobacteria bacterium]